MDSKQSRQGRNAGGQGSRQAGMQACTQACKQAGQASKSLAGRVQTELPEYLSSGLLDGRALDKSKSLSGYLQSCPM